MVFFLWNRLHSRLKRRPRDIPVSSENQPISTPLLKIPMVFSNDHWNVSYHYGVAKFIQTYLDLDQIELKGISFGSLPVLCLHYELNIDHVFQSWKQELYHSNPCLFLWKYWKGYSKWCHTWFQNRDPKYETSVWLYKHPNCFEVNTLHPKEILNLSYSLPFPSILPRKLVNYGYVRDCPWHRPNEMTISLTDSKTFPTPIPLQVRSWYYASEQDLDQLFEIGYLTAFLFFHQNPMWIPYFKQPPKVEDLWSLREISNRVQSYLEDYK